MHDGLPDTWDAAVRWFLGGTVVFALGFEGITMMLGARFLLSGVAFIVALALLAFMVYWPPGGSVILVLVAAALFSFLGTMEACKRFGLTGGQKMLTTIGIALMIVAVLCAGIGGAVLFVSIGNSTQGPSLGQPETVPPQKVSYLKDVHLYTGSASPPVNPRFAARFARNGQRARLYAEDRYYVAGLGAGAWIHAPQVRLGEIKDFVTGDPVDIAILTPFESDGRKLWRWGPSTEKPDPKTTFQSSAWHQGRLVLLVDNEPPEYFYFIIDLAAPDVPPNVIGQERFDFAQKWESGNGQQK